MRTYIDLAVGLCLFAASLTAYLVQGDDVTKDLAIGSFGAVIALLRGQQPPAG